MRRTLGPNLGFRHKHTKPPIPATDPLARVDQAAQVVKINDDDSVVFQLGQVDLQREVPLAEITVVYATVTPPEVLTVEWFLDPLKGFPTSTQGIAPGQSGEITVPVANVPDGISFVQVIWGYAE